MTGMVDHEAAEVGSAQWRPPAAPPSAGEQPTVIIEARPQSTARRLLSLWQYRGFYGFLFKEILMRRARGTLLGFWWLILRPLISAAGFIFLFSVVAPLPTGQDIPYPVFFLSGYLPWRLFQGTLVIVPRSLGWTRAIMRRTYFPRLLVPFAAFGPVLIELGVLAAIFAIAVGMASSGGGAFPLRLGWQMLVLLPSLACGLLFALAFGMVLSIVALFFRDIIFTVRYMSQMVMFFTPVLYPVTVVPESYRWVIYTLNPMAQVVEVSRWALTGRGTLDLLYVTVAFAMILTTFGVAVTFFLRAEAHLGDQL